MKSILEDDFPESGAVAKRPGRVVEYVLFIIIVVVLAIAAVSALGSTSAGFEPLIDSSLN